MVESCSKGSNGGSHASDRSLVGGRESVREARIRLGCLSLNSGWPLWVLVLYNKQGSSPYLHISE